MSEKSEKTGPRIVEGPIKPKKEEGIEWEPVYGDFWNQDRVTGWKGVLITSDSNKPSKDPSKKENEEKDFPTFIEKSLPKGD